jgi:hypothetical protein
VGAKITEDLSASRNRTAYPASRANDRHVSEVPEETDEPEVVRHAGLFEKCVEPVGQLPTVRVVEVAGKHDLDVPDPLLERDLHPVGPFFPLLVEGDRSRSGPNTV